MSLQDHFEQSQFEEIARSSAGGKKLKPNAIPTLFSFGEPPYPAITSPYILLPMKSEPGMGMKINLFLLALEDECRNVFQLCRVSVVEKELNFGDHGYARRIPLPGLDNKEGDRADDDQQTCTQCQILKKQLEKEMQHTARLQKEVGCCW